MVLHVQALLGLSGLILGAVAYHSVTMWQVEVECDQRAVLHAQSPQCRAVNLEEGERKVELNRGSDKKRKICEKTWK